MADGFKEACEGYLNERCGDKWTKYGFDLLYRTVLDTLELDRESGAVLTAVASRCVAILNGERDKLRRIDEWNEKQKRKS